MSKVYIVVHDFVSHDMFVADDGSDPKVVGVYSTRALANKQVRPDMDDYIVALTLDAKAAK